MPNVAKDKKKIHRHAGLFGIPNNDQITK